MFHIIAQAWRSRGGSMDGGTKSIREQPITYPILKMKAFVTLQLDKDKNEM